MTRLPNKRISLCMIATCIFVIIFAQIELFQKYIGSIEFQINVYYQNSSSPSFAFDNSLLINNNSSSSIDATAFIYFNTKINKNDHIAIVTNNNKNNGVIKGKENFTYPFSKNRGRQCTSPEKVEWIFGDNNNTCNNDHDNNKRDYEVYSRTSHRRCHICSHDNDNDNDNQNNSDKTKFLKFLQKLSLGISSKHNETCSRLVAYSVAFGSKYTKSFNKYKKANVNTLHEYHNSCFFNFVLDEGKMKYDHYNYTSLKLSNDGLEYLIPIPQHVLPYKR